MTHYLMICGGECLIANEAPIFMESLKVTIRQLAKDAAIKLQLDDDDDNAINLLWRSAVDPKREKPREGNWARWKRLFSQAVFRCDESADGLYIGPIPKQCTRKKVLQTMLSILYERFKKNQTRFSATTLLLLNIAVELKDGAVLEAALEALNGKVPKCTLTYLLENAIGRWFDEGVDLLLNKCNASPVDGILDDVDRKPLALCSAQMTSARQGHAHPYYLLQIWKLVLGKLSSTTSFKNVEEDDIFTPAFANLCDIAVVYSNAVELLIETGRDYLKHFRSNDDDQEEECDSTSHIWSAMKRCFATKRPDDPPYSRQEIAQIVAYAILPLLRAGCRCSFTSYDKFRKAFAGLFQSTSQHDRISSYVFGRVYGFYDLAIEAFVKPEMPKFASSEMMMRSDSDQGSSNSCCCYYSDDEMMEEDGLTAQFRRQSPLRLKKLARQAVLKRLPFGLSARRHAINDMDVSPAIRDFLNFNDLEPLPDSMAIIVDNF